ncbi:hypothetical protein PAXRUDRAFT_782547 [Paxillus rubicundulus Ve08.2h10]|uniref:Uncharacterized protein n=1 Tax=Paxillus rubicundulus Ve08.2h10 TaxID=930991 RepID=A0A0D0CLV3_9AGAM|nr:hypothetical protein PAXRUDRAFT_782547 [Paxillus rubicundulus Ve08.2h10]
MISNYLFSHYPFVDASLIHSPIPTSPINMYTCHMLMTPPFPRFPMMQDSICFFKML